MPDFNTLMSTYRSRLLLVAVLVASTLLSLGALAARRFISGSHMYHFLPFNLFLAWLPFAFAVAMYWLHARGSNHNRLMLALGFLWLLFLPNAPYLWTDLVHIVLRRSASVYWCDLILGITYGWNGMLLGLLSLRIVHRIARDRLGAAQGWLIALVSLALGSFSISLGRLDRFNSWDVFFRPASLIYDATPGEGGRPVDQVASTARTSGSGSRAMSSPTTTPARSPSAVRTVASLNRSPRRWRTWSTGCRWRWAQRPRVVALAQRCRSLGSLSLAQRGRRLGSPRGGPRKRRPRRPFTQDAWALA